MSASGRTVRGQIDVGSIAEYPAVEACGFVDSVIGLAEAWSSPLISYRLTSDFQASWKCEFGRWLLFARDRNFLPQILQRIERARKALDTPLWDGRPDPNDSAHIILHQEVAAAEVAYYLTASGWSFEAIPPSQPGFDVDLRMKTLRGNTADLQIKASDRLGRIIDGRRYDGEVDAHVTSGIAKAFNTTG